MNLMKLVRKVLDRGAGGQTFHSQHYWEARYRQGGNSGAGSYSHLAEFKADVMNSFVADNAISDVMEFGCGDGNQLSLAAYPRYLGIDVSETVIAQCRKRFANDSSKRFVTLERYQGQQAELALSMDVLYHLVETEVFEHYMRQLFAAATRYVVIYSSDSNEVGVDAQSPHVRHRKFTEWVAATVPGWTLKQVIPNRYPFDGDHARSSFSDFYIYAQTPSTATPP